MTARSMNMAAGRPSRNTEGPTPRVRRRALRSHRTYESRVLRLHGIDAHLLAIAPTALEGHPAADQREQGEVAADADVRSRLHLRAALADEHATGRDLRAGVRLHAQPLTLAVPPVAGRSHALLVRHGLPSVTA